MEYQKRHESWYRNLQLSNKHCTPKILRSIYRRDILGTKLISMGSKRQGILFRFLCYYTHEVGILVYLS